MFPGVPLEGYAPMASLIDRSIRSERMLSTLLTAFGVIGLFLTAVGLFGVTAYAASKRTREMGIRKAMGAVDRDIVRLMVGGGLRGAAVGCILGALASIAMSGVLERTLYGVSPSDVVSIAAAAVLMLATSAGAAYLPARRGARIEPTEALRHE